MIIILWQAFLKIQQHLKDPKVQTLQIIKTQEIIKTLETIRIPAIINKTTIKVIKIQAIINKTAIKVIKMEVNNKTVMQHCKSKIYVEDIVLSI